MLKVRILSVKDSKFGILNLFCFFSIKYWIIQCISCIFDLLITNVMTTRNLNAPVFQNKSVSAKYLEYFCQLFFCCSHFWGTRNYRIHLFYRTQKIIPYFHSTHLIRGTCLGTTGIIFIPFAIILMIQTIQQTYAAGMWFRMMLPNGYDISDPNTKYPLILFLHGSGERGTTNVQATFAWRAASQRCCIKW
jgi:hypothetical protein